MTERTTGPSTALAMQRIAEAGQGSGVGVYVQLAGNAGHEGLQRVGEALAGRHAVGGKRVWVWVWAWDMDMDGPAACVSYAAEDAAPVTEWTDPQAVALYYLMRGTDGVMA